MRILDVLDPSRENMDKEQSRSLQKTRIKMIIEETQAFTGKGVAMVGYGALINSDLMNQLNNAMNSLANTLREVPFYWYIAALAGMFIFFKLLIKK